MERLKATLIRESRNMTSVERDFIERFIKNIVFEKDRNQAEINYLNYSSYVNDLSNYHLPMAANERLKSEVDRVYSIFNIMKWN